MVTSIGKIASPSQGVSYFERDGFYAKDDPAHRDASTWAGTGAAALGLSGPAKPDAFAKASPGFHNSARSSKNRITGLRVWSA